MRPAGEEALAGEVLIAAGTRLTAAQAGLAAAAGHDRLEVYRRPTATLLIFGDELLRSGPAGSGRVRDSLGPSLPALLADLGVELLAVHYVADTLAAHTEALRGARTDLVFTTGGTANGPVDYLHDAIEATGGEVLIDTVACRPGHPMLLAGWGERWLVGLPGNPQAAIVALLTLGAPLVAGCLGQPLPPLGRARISASEKTRGRATRLIPCRLERDLATPVEHIGSGMLRGLAAADGFAVVRQEGVLAGGEVDWLPLP